MAQFVVRNLEDDVKARLKRRAARHGRSMEEEARHSARCREEPRSRCDQSRIPDCGAFCKGGAHQRVAGIARSAPTIGRIR